MRFRAPASILLRRAQLTLMIATLIPTVLMLAVGIVLLAVGSGTGALAVVSGVLVLAFCTTALTGYILGSIFVSRGASLARVQNDFLSSVSHELRTPLTSIGLFIDSLRDERMTDEEDKRRCLDLLKQEVTRLETLVEKLIRLSQIKTGRAAFERAPVAIADVISDAYASLSATAMPEKVELKTAIEPNLWTLGDRDALAQAVGNLLINAWKYTNADDRQIEVSVTPHSGWVQIDVSDNGQGIPRSEHRTIWHRFERGKQAMASAVGGIGLGLPTVKAIIEAHRGKVEVRSRAGQGSTFSIRLRAAAPAQSGNE